MSGKIIIVREQSMVMSVAVWLYAGYANHEKIICQAIPDTPNNYNNNNNIRLHCIHCISIQLRGLFTQNLLLCPKHLGKVVEKESRGLDTFL